MQATIEIRYADGKVETRVLSEATSVIGREQGDIVLGDPLVSGRHGELSLSGQELSFRDLGSSNGSFLPDGQRISEPVTLSEGQSVKLGNCLIKLVRLSSSQRPAPARRPPAKGTIVMNPGLGVQAPEAPAQPASPAPQASEPAPTAATPLPPAMTENPPAMSSAPPPSSGPAPASQGIWDEQPSSEPSDDGFGDGGFAASGFSQAAAGELDPAGFLAAPLGVTPGNAGTGMSDFFDQLKQRLQFTRQLLEPHLMPIAKFVAIVLGPFALLQVIGGMFPVAGAVISVPASMIQGVLSGFFVAGVIAQFALRIQRGESPDVKECTSSHLSLIAAWTLTTIVVGILAFIGFFFFILPAIILSWGAVAAFTIEGKRYAAAAMRSFEVFRGDWLFVLQGLAIAFIAYLPAWILASIVAVIPILSYLTPLVSLAIQAVMLPFISVYTFGLFLEARTRIANKIDM